MLSDDIYRSRMQATVASLRYWAPSIKDVAVVEDAESADYWRMTVSPIIANACPFELMLRADQRHDWMIAGEPYEDRDIVSLELFLPLVEAITEGRVVKREWTRRATGVVHTVETLIALPGGRIWQDRRDNGHAPPTSNDAEVLRTDRHFVPYRR